MGLIRVSLLGFLAVAWLASSSTSIAALIHEESHVNRTAFPNDFVFGVSTAALQIEGSIKDGGRGPSIWDVYAKIPGKIMDGSNFDTATDSYNRYKEDVKAIKELGVRYYRFSISWTRILPNGSLSGGISQEGINHYNSLIDELIKNGITPFVTMFHFDVPQALYEQYGGFLNSSIVKDFKDYCEILFKTYGDRVKNWITINEPYIMAVMGHDIGVAAPGRCSIRAMCPEGDSAREPYIVSHNILLAHAAVAKLYNDNFKPNQGGQIGISLVGQYYEPYSNSTKDKAAQKRALDFSLGWYVEPLVYGDYPKSMRELVKERLPNFSEEEKELVKGSCDFIGINYYTARYAKSIPIDQNALPLSYTDDQFVNQTESKNGVLIGPQSENSIFIYIYPKGLQKLLEFIKETYQNPKLYVTENGVTGKGYDNRSLNEVLNDTYRIKFIQQHLYRILQAVKNGVNVKGYFYWSLFDDFEWGEGYNVRYGLYYVDFKHNLQRIPKRSATWLLKFLKGA